MLWVEAAYQQLPVLQHIGGDEFLLIVDDKA
jgi:hypothetical protein